MTSEARNKKGHSIFADAADPDLSDLEGEFLVNILMAPGYSRCGHRKVFYTQNRRISGHNILFGKTWGHFDIGEEVVRLPEPETVAVINYNRSENSLFTRRIRDHLRCVKKGRLYIGKAYFLLFGRMIFLGHFTLEKEGLPDRQAG